MDEELYAVLMGDMPKGELMSKALRRQQAVGTLGMITGDAALAPTGQALFKDAGSQAWRESELDMNRRRALAQALEADQQRKWLAEQNRLNRANTLQAAGIRANQGGKADWASLYRLGKQYSSSGIPDLENSLGALEEEMKLYGEGDDLPGVGATGMAPMGLLTEQGRSLRQKLASVRNILLKVRSGSAVTDQEFQRFAEELGQFMGASDAEIRRSIPQIRASLEAAKNAIYAGYDPNVSAYYQSRLEGGGSGGMQDQAQEEGEVDITKLSDEELRRIANGG